MGCNSSVLKNSGLRRNVHGVADQCNCNECFENPLEEYPGLEMRQIITADDQLNQLITGNECQDDSCYWHDHILRKCPDHGKHSG